MRSIFALIAAALIPFASVAGAAVGGPAVRPLALDPLSIRGVHFKPAERVLVRVSVRGGARLTKQVTAGARGSFTARFASLHLGECSAFTIRADGARSGRAAYTALFPPCGPAP